jgi:hypothetical protein
MTWCGQCQVGGAAGADANQPQHGRAASNAQGGLVLSGVVLGTPQLDRGEAATAGAEEARVVRQGGTRVPPSLTTPELGLH